MAGFHKINILDEIEKSWGKVKIVKKNNYFALKVLEVTLNFFWNIKKITVIVSLLQWIKNKLIIRLVTIKHSAS